MTPGDRVRYHNAEGEPKDGRLLDWKIQDYPSSKGINRVHWALVQFRGRRRAYCHPGQLEVLK